MWGSDIGGYEGGGDVTPELLGRWAQFDALTPIFEVGGAGANARSGGLEPTRWSGSERQRRSITNSSRTSTTSPNVHREAGCPPIRPLGLTWPGTVMSLGARDAEFTVGTSLLAAPVIVSATNGNIATTKVYLPPGRWIDFFTGRRLTGGRTVTRSSGPDGFPLYVHEGSGFPRYLRLPAVWAEPLARQRPDPGRTAGLDRAHRGQAYVRQRVLRPQRSAPSSRRLAASRSAPAPRGTRTTGARARAFPHLPSQGQRRGGATSSTAKPCGHSPRGG